MSQEKNQELDLNQTNLTYRQLNSETPDIFKQLPDKCYNSFRHQHNLCEDIESRDQGLNDLKICNNSSGLLSKSCSSESEACSSTLLLEHQSTEDMVLSHHHHDHRLMSSPSFPLDYNYDPFNHQQFPFEVNPSFGYQMTPSNEPLEGINENKISANSDVPSDEEQDQVWSKFQNSVAANMRQKYLQRSDSSSGKSSRSLCLPMVRLISKDKLSSTWFLGFIFLCSLIAIIMGGLTVVSYLRGNKGFFQIVFDFNANSALHGLGTERGDPVDAALWHQSAVFYEIFPASFKDSDGDGFGDLQGLREKIPFLRDLGVTVVRLNSIFSALDYPYQYENVVDFFRVDPHLGSISDFKALATDLHSHGMHLVLDINPGLSSDQHPWAAHWLLNTSGDFKHFYVQTNRENEIPLDVTSSTAQDRTSRELEEIHLSFGGHLFLNWSHAGVKSKMFEVFEFWSNLGADGFYLKSLDMMQVLEKEEEGLSLFHILRELSNLLNHKARKKILIASRESLERINERNKRQMNIKSIQVSDLRDSAHHLASSPSSGEERNVFLYLDLIDTYLDIKMNSTENIREQVNAVFLNEPRNSPSILWNIGSATTSRLTSRVGGANFTSAATFLLLMLPGSVSLFFGDELSLKDSFDTNSNKEYRGGQLCPMPWASMANGNFTGSNTTEPWLPLNKDYMKNNVQRQPEAMTRIQRLIHFRKKNLKQVHPRLQKTGNYLFHYISGGEIVLERYFSERGVGREGDVEQTQGVTRVRFVLFANLANDVKVKDLRDKFRLGSIKVTSNPKRMGDFLYFRSLRLDPGEAIIAQVE